MTQPASTPPGEPARPPIRWPAGRVDLLYDRFKAQIVDRAWGPDTPLNIDRLAREHGVSITPVREALSRLAADRLVVALPHRGYRVAPLPSPERFAELCAVRLLLEPHAARGAAAALDPADLEALQALQERIAALGGDPQEGQEAHSFVALNSAFHQRIFAANGNGVLAEIYAGLGYHVLSGYVFHRRGLYDLQQVVAEHRAILDALRAADPALAEAAMYAHIERGSRRLMTTYARDR